MKSIQKKQARILRKEGYSMYEISKRLKVSKSSVSLWVRDIVLTIKQEQYLHRKGFTSGAIETRRQARLQNELIKREFIIQGAQKDVQHITRRELWIIGTVLYWAEGGKTQRGLVRFSNGDAKMIKLMMLYFRKICHVPERKFRGHIHLNSELDSKRAEQYWTKESSIPLKQFFKTYLRDKHSSKTTLPHGTMDIYICDTKLFLTIQGWIMGIYKNIPR